jgi:hypothetical protein
MSTWNRMDLQTLGGSQLIMYAQKSSQSLSWPRKNDGVGAYAGLIPRAQC